MGKDRQNHGRGEIQKEFQQSNQRRIVFWLGRADETSVRERGNDKRGARGIPKTKTDTEVRRRERNILYGNSELLKEVIINVIINKSLLSSLFNEKLNELNGEQISGKKLEQGEYAETPKYLEDYEIEELKDLRN